MPAVSARQTAIVIFIVAALLWTAAIVHCQGVARFVRYHSPIDDSIQEYGVYLPSVPPPSRAGYPAVLHGHGYGWRVSASFSDFQRRWAEEHGWVMINVNARGPNFYEGVGDIETLNVVEHATAHFGLDPNRIYMTGGSMGGSGALRHGLRHPDVFAAVMGVDGWTDFRIWHWEWYAREDYRDEIEEFRRPLLKAASPLYWAERGRLGAIGHIVDGMDTVVLPEHGLRLHARLRELRIQDPGGYDHKLIYNPLLGHGRGTDYQAIYSFFKGRERVEKPAGFHIESVVLKHAELYWGRIESFLIDGMLGSLQVHSDEDVVHARTRNIGSFTLQLGAGPLPVSQVRVIADGFPCYEGPARTVTFAADLDERGAVAGWRVAERSASGAGDSAPPRKRPGLSGPIGEAFLRPFVVAWATDGPAQEVARHRIEAEQFASDWNDFMVRAEGLEALPEHRLTPAHINSRNVILFGSVDTSSLLRRADAMHRFPVVIGSNAVIVRDPLHGERRYVGEKYGAMMVYPNPLSGFSTFVVVVNRRVFTRPDGAVPQLLAYDLEKLPWAYPDYVVFNNDQDELPFVLNVNNKPPVTCYEAAYFVEAGFFDDRWQVDHAGELRRTRLQKPENHRFARVDKLTMEGAVAVVRVTDSSGDPVHTARVTGRWWGQQESVASASTDGDGMARFPMPVAASSGLSFEVVNVMATGCTWDWRADSARRLAPTSLSPGQIYLTPLNDRSAVRPDGSLAVRLMAHNASPRSRRVSVGLRAPSGRLAPERRDLLLDPGGRGEVHFTWWPRGREAGRVNLHAEALSRGTDVAATASLNVPVTVLPDWGLPLVVADVKASDIDFGGSWKVTATLRHFGDEDTEATVHCAIMEAAHHRAAKTVTVPAGGSVRLEWTGDEVLDRGQYRARVTVDGGYGITGTGDFAVR